MRACDFAAWAASLVMAALAAGCIDGGPAGEEPTSEPSDTVAADVSWSLALEECVVGAMFGAVPSDWAAPFWSDGFSPAPPGAGVDQVTLQLFDCGRLVGPGVVEENVRFLEAGLIAEQDFDPDTPRQTVLVVETYTDSATLASVLEGYGAPVRSANITPQSGSLGAGLGLGGWTVAGDGFGFSLRFLDGRLSAGESSWSDQVWYGGPPHTRRDAAATEEYAAIADLDTVALSLEGDTRMNRLFGSSPSWILGMQLNWNGQYRLTFNGGYEP